MTMMAGIWSETEGGFVDGPLYTQGEAEQALADQVKELEADDDPGDLSIVPMCQEPGEEHGEQREDSCEGCAADDDDEEDEDDE